MSRSIAAATALVLGAPMASAQEAINTRAATQPGQGIFKLRVTPRSTAFSDDPTGEGRSIDQFQLDAAVSYGITGEWSATLDLPLKQRWIEGESDDDDFGLGDVALEFKYRFLTHSSGPIDTTRVAAIAGLEIPSYDSPFSTESFNPAFGLVYTRIAGRHGVNLDLHYTLTTGGERFGVEPGETDADLFEISAAYLYRFVPARYEADTFASWYGVLEINSAFETNGDHVVYLSPGILYEARNIGLELGVQAPVSQEADHRFETDWSIVFGVRWFF